MNRKHLADIIHVLRAFTRAPEYGGWTAELLGEGKQAVVYRVRRRNGRPAWGDHDALAVKLFKPDEPGVPDAAYDEFLAMAQLCKSLACAPADGWSVTTPAPLFHCFKPIGIVMTCVGGRSLVNVLRDDDSLANDDSLVESLLSALRQFWGASGRIYGDLNFSNVLCDLDARSLCFVDPGMPERCYRCDDVPCDFAPASRDLAYLLFESAAAVRAHLGEPLVRSAMIHLSTRMIEKHAATLDGARRHAFLDEVRACAWSHLRRIRVGATPGGIWRRAVRRIAAKTIESVLLDLRDDESESTTRSTSLELTPCLPSLSK